MLGEGGPQCQEGLRPRPSPALSPTSPPAPANLVLSSWDPVQPDRSRELEPHSRWHAWKHWQEA